LHLSFKDYLTAEELSQPVSTDNIDLWQNNEEDHLRFKFGFFRKIKDDLHAVDESVNIKSIIIDKL
jgi:hypothetical protein